MQRKSNTDNMFFAIREVGDALPYKAREKYCLSEKSRKKGTAPKHRPLNAFIHPF